MLLGITQETKGELRMLKIMLCWSYYVPTKLYLNARLLRNFSLLYLLNKHSYIQPYLQLYDLKKNTKVHFSKTSILTTSDFKA